MDDAQAKRLYDTLVWLTANPDKHEQGIYIEVNHDEFVTREAAEAAWDCGTAGCLAGHAAIYDGWRPKVNTTSFFDEEPIFWLSDTFVTKGEETYSVDDVANELFGLDDEQGEWLYYGNNTIDDLWRIADELSDGRINAEDRSFRR